MVPVTKTEKEEILKKYPHVFITRTMKQDSKRGHYYCEEEKNVMRYLREIRNRNVIEDHRPARKR